MTKLPDGMESAVVFADAFSTAVRLQGLCRMVEARDAQWSAERDRLAARLAEVERERDEQIEITNAVVESHHNTSAERDALRAENERMRKALERISLGDVTVGGTWSEEVLRMEITVYRRIAASALNPQPEQPERK